MHADAAVARNLQGRFADVEPGDQPEQIHLDAFDPAELDAEQAEFTRTMEARVAAHEAAIHELEVALTSAQKRAAEATRKRNSEARRADLAEREGRETTEQLEAAEARAAEAIVRVAELEQEIDVLKAEVLAWQSAPARRHA